MIFYRQEWIEDSARHASEVDVMYWLKRNPAGEEKARKDAYHGKIGEFVAAQLFCRFGAFVTRPDCGLIENDQKRHREDLAINSVSVSVKTVVFGHGLSWVFQDSDISNRFRSKPWHVLVVLFSDVGFVFDVLSDESVKTILKPLRKPIDNKRAAYACDISLPWGEAQAFLEDCELDTDAGREFVRAVLRWRERYDFRCQKQLLGRAFFSGRREPPCSFLLEDGYQQIKAGRFGEKNTVIAKASGQGL